MSLRTHLRILRSAKNYDIGKPPQGTVTVASIDGSGRGTVTLNDPDGAVTFSEPRDLRELNGNS